MGQGASGVSIADSLPSVWLGVAGMGLVLDVTALHPVLAPSTALSLGSLRWVGLKTGPGRQAEYGGLWACSVTGRTPPPSHPPSPHDRGSPLAGLAQRGGLTVC